MEPTGMFQPNLRNIVIQEYFAVVTTSFDTPSSREKAELYNSAM